MSTEDLLRHALDDLAPRVPAGDEALTGVRRAITRRRRRRAAARTAVAAILLAAVAAAGLVANAGGDEGSSSDYVGQPRTVPPATGEQVRFGPVSFALPEGWDVIEPETATSSATGNVPSYIMCVGPTATEAPQYPGCPGLTLHRGWLPGHEMEPYRTGADWAWSDSTDPPLCPTGDPYDSVISDPAEGADGMAPIAVREEPVGDRAAEYTEWAAMCSQSGYRFGPRAWLLPEHDVLIKDVLGNSPETESILSSFEFTDE